MLTEIYECLIINLILIELPNFLQEISLKVRTDTSIAYAVASRRDDRRRDSPGRLAVRISSPNFRRGNFSCDFVADKAQVGSCVARLDAICHVANLRGVHSSLLSTGGGRWSTLPMLSTALRRGIPPQPRRPAWKTCTEYNGRVKCVAAAPPKWALLAHMLARTNRADRPRGNTWERRPDRQAGRLRSFLFPFAVPFSSNLVFPRHPPCSPPNYGVDL